MTTACDCTHPDCLGDHYATHASVDRWKGDLLRAANRRTFILREATLEALTQLPAEHPARARLDQALADVAMVRP